MALPRKRSTHVNQFWGQKVGATTKLDAHEKMTNNKGEKQTHCGNRCCMPCNAGEVCSPAVRSGSPCANKTRESTQTIPPPVNQASLINNWCKGGPGYLHGYQAQS
jgi:hypothetical protein